MSDSPISRKYDTPLNLRHAGILFGRRQIDGNPRLDVTGSPNDGAGALVAEAHDLLSNVQSRSIETLDSNPYADNLDPWKVRIPRVGRNAWQRMKKQLAARRAFLAQVASSEFPLMTRFDILRSGRQLTPEELREVHEDIEAHRLYDFHRSQAQLGLHRIVNTLTRLKHCNYTEKEGHRYIKSEVVIEYIEVCALYYRYYVKASALPFGVSIMDIQGDAVCTDLSTACFHPVRSELKMLEKSVIGLQYTIEIAATMGVPDVCKFSELLPQVPASAQPLAFLTGYSEGKRVRYANLEDMPHLLGGGQTKGGKSNMMHVVACSLISRNTPNDLQLLMIDLKFNGIEMDRYKGVPHLIHQHDGSKPGEFVASAPSGIATIPEQAIAVLQWALDEAHRRGTMFTKQGVQNLRQWNHRHPGRRLPYIVIINDELGLLRLEKEFGQQAYDLLQKILSTARAAGISFVTFTQSSNSRVIDEFIKINLPGRICFSVTDAPSSILFVGNGAAVGLMPAGRAIYKHGTEQYLCQTPLIEPKDIAEVVANAKQGKLTVHLSARPVLPEEVIAWAIEYNQSSLAVRDVFHKFGGELQRIDLHSTERLLKEMEGRDYRVGDRVYQILPGVGNRPRVLIRLDKLMEGAAAGPFSRDETRDTDDSPLRCAYCRELVDDVAAVECQACGAPL